VTNKTIEHINTPQKLGLAVKRLRKISGLSQEELAQKIKVRQPTLSDVENGRGTIESLFKIIQGLQLNLSLAVEGSIAKEKTTGDNNAQKALEYLRSLERMKS
jgi:transcriptional regulator with XRE-family HTH domain